MSKDNIARQPSWWPEDLACTCGSRDIRVTWLAICDVSWCQACGRQWSVSEDVEFGYDIADPERYAHLPAVNAKQFLSPEARAAGEAAQDLALIGIKVRKKQP
jgi:hypothetical protein